MVGPYHINKKLRQARRKKYMWTMEEAAEKIGVSLVTYSRWELGVQYPHLRTLKTICEVFQMTADELGFGDSSE